MWLKLRYRSSVAVFPRQRSLFPGILRVPLECSDMPEPLVLSNLPEEPVPATVMAAPGCAS